MAILRRLSSRASAPKSTSSRPKAAGISAVILTLSLPKYPPTPSTMSMIPNPMVVFAKLRSSFFWNSYSSNCLSMLNCVVLSHMKCATFLLLAALPLCAQVKITQHTDRISIETDGKPFTDMFVGADTTKPYLWPLRAASGKVVTRAFPMDMVEGETRDHPHQRGLWFSHGDVNGLDFWGNEMSQHVDDGKRGRIVLKKVGDLKSGKKMGSLSATFDWVDPQGKALLTESRTIVFYSNPTLRIMDFDINLRALEKVTFGDTKEGTF